MQKLKGVLSNTFLRGPVLRAWIKRKAAKLDREFTRTLLEESQRGSHEPRLGPIRSSSIRSILFICDNMWEEYYLLPELQKICPVTFLNLHSALKGHVQSDWWELSLQAIRTFIEQKGAYEPGLIFFYARPALLSEQVFSLLRKRWSCPVFGMNLDDKMEFLDYQLFSHQPGNYQSWAKYFDLNVTNTVVTTDWYKNRGFPVYYMPQGFRSRLEFPYPETLRFEHEIAFLGSRKPERESFVRKLNQYGVNVKLFGYGWPDSQSVAEPETVFRASMMNLGIGWASPSDALTTTKGRDFECPGAGACYITTYNWELCEHYELGKEILCYRNLEELVEMYAFYRRRPENCLKIAQAAYLRCQNEHTWEKRFRKLFREVGIV